MKKQILLLLTTRPDDEGIERSAVITDQVEAQLYWVERVNSVETETFIIGKQAQIIEVTLVDPDPETGNLGVYRTLVEEIYFNEERTGEEEG